MAEIVKLTSQELVELQRCEQIIQDGLQTTGEVIMALKTIKDGKLYRQDYRSFEAYDCDGDVSCPRPFQPAPALPAPALPRASRAHTRALTRGCGGRATSRGTTFGARWVATSGAAGR